jgi:potassium efflux system protein
VYDETQRAELTVLYNSALDQLRAAEEWSAIADEFDKTIQTAPAEVARLQESLQQPPEELKPDVPEGAKVALIEGLLARQESTLSSLRARRAVLEKELLERTDRRRQLPELLTDARTRLQEVSSAGVVMEPDPVTEGKQVLAAATRACIEKEISAYERELESYEVRGQLLTLQLYESARDSSAQDQLVQAWRQTLREKRRQEAVEAVQKARDTFAAEKSASPAARQIAEQLAKEAEALITQRTAPDGLAERSEKAAATLQKLKERQAELDGNFKRLSKKVDAVGLNNSIGLLLRRYRKELPDIAEHQANVRARRDEIDSVQVEQIELQEKRLELEDIDSLLRTYLLPERRSSKPEDLEKVEKALRNLLQIQRDTLDALLRDYDTY